MPKKVPPSVEEELDIQPKKTKSENFITNWFKDYAVNDAADIKIICDMTARSAEEQFFMSADSGNTEIYATIFYGIFLSILDFIREKQKRYNNFTIAIANSVNLGYTNNDNDENEKIGNFMPVMEYIGINHNVMSDIGENKTTENILEWKDLNAKKNAEFYREIQEKAHSKLISDYRVRLRSSEAVIPLFCIFLDHVTRRIKFKYEEAQGTDVSEVRMNVLGLFDIFYSFNEQDNVEIYEYQPNIMMKLALKSDANATRD